MKRYRRSVFISLLIALLGGCSGPFWQFPGGALVGTQTPLDTGSQPTGNGVLELETNPADPYSVHVGFVVIDRTIYIDPADDRTWYQYIQQDANVRIRFDGSKDIHPVLAIAETDPAVLKQFASDRNVLKLVPRQ